MAGVTNREFWDFRVKTRAQFTKLAEQIANIDTSGGGGISELTSKMVVDALGYTPYNANNPANYITSAALTPYLKTEDAEETYATKDFVNNKLVDYAPLTSVQGFENRISGLEGAVPRLNARVETVESKVATLNETVSTGENNLLDRVNAIEEEYATKTYVDNAIDGIDLSPYLKTEDAKETYATKYFVNNKLINYATIGSVTAIQNTLTGQIGAVNASVEQLAATKLDSSYFTLTNIQFTLGISDWALAATKPSYAWSEITSRPTALSQFTDDVVAGKYLPLSGGTLSNAAWRSQLTIERSGSTNDSAIAFSNSNGLLGCLGYRGADGVPCVWLGETGTGAPIIHANNIDSYNAGSATKLKTTCKLWGKSFDGTADVSGDLYSDIWKIIKDSVWNGTFIQSANYDGTSDLGNIYMSAMGGKKLTSFNVWANNSEFSDNVTVAGNVGIGTTSPTERLDVSGNIKADGNINATSITINGVTITASNGSITVNGNVFATGDITGFV